MSTSVAKTLPIGPVRAYWNSVRMGSGMGQAAIRRTKETVQYGLEDSNVNVGSHMTKETIEIDIVVADFKAHQMRYAYSQAESKASSTTIYADGYDNNLATFNHWFLDEIKLTGTTAVAVDQAAFVTGTIKVYKTDWSNTPDGYTRGTDWTGTNTNGNIKRISGGSITDGETVYVEYRQSATSDVVYAGGKLADFEGSLRLTHQMDNGKHLTIYADRAKLIGASDFAIQMAAQFGGVALTFHILAEMTNAPGKQLIQVGVEE